MVQCEPSWAGRFVIGLQLLSWCAVGAILLHRGFSSIQLKKPDNVYDARPVLTNLTVENDDVDALTESMLSSVNLTDQTVLNGERTEPPLTDNWVDELETQTENGDSTPLADDGQPLAGRTPTHVHNVRVATPKPTPNKKKYELTASGLVMVALGAVMLVVGPSVVILRCCDAVGQGRRFNKLSADDTDATLAALDLPPPYDEVADADADVESRAPRYSMIFPESVVEDVELEEIRRG